MQVLNDKNASHRKKGKKIVRFLIPALLAIAVHISFFGFKKAETPETPSPLKSKQVMLLPLTSNRPQEQKLLAWMEILDPSYFIQPNRKYGFSTALKPDNIKDITIELKKQSADNGNDQDVFITVPWQPRRERIKDQWKYQAPGITAIDLSQFKKNLQYPVWMSEENDILPQLFENIKDLNKIIESKIPFIQETVMKVDFYGPVFFPKVLIERSCGIKELDKIAMRTLIVKGKRLAINDKDSKEPFFITVKWYSKE